MPPVSRDAATAQPGRYRYRSIGQRRTSRRKRLPDLTALAAFEAVTARGRAPALPAPGRPAALSVRGATAIYPGQVTRAVRDGDLDLPPGRRIAIVGATGAGKSTLASVLFRFTDLTAGTVLLNGQDLAGYGPGAVTSPPRTWTRRPGPALTADLLLITHNLDGLDQVDVIVVLDHGRVAERGTHAGLARARGIYQRLWQAGHRGPWSLT